MFPRNSISLRGDDVKWPIRSPDLVLCEHCFCEITTKLNSVNFVRRFWKMWIWSKNCRNSQNYCRTVKIVWTGVFGSTAIICTTHFFYLNGINRGQFSSTKCSLKMRLYQISNHILSNYPARLTLYFRDSKLISSFLS